jgi:hypothetical protein
MGISRNFNRMRRGVRKLMRSLVAHGGRPRSAAPTVDIGSAINVLPSIDLSVIKSLQWLNAFIAIQFTTSSVCKPILMKAS